MASCHSSMVRGCSTCADRSSAAVAITLTGIGLSRSCVPGQRLGLDQDVVHQVVEGDHRPLRSHPPRVDERPGRHVLEEDVRGTATVAEQQADGDEGAGRTAVDDVERVAQPRLLQRVHHAAGVRAAHAAAVDDQRDPVAVVARAGPAPVQQGVQHLVVPGQLGGRPSTATVECPSSHPTIMPGFAARARPFRRVRASSFSPAGSGPRRGSRRHPRHRRRPGRPRR